MPSSQHAAERSWPLSAALIALKRKLELDAGSRWCPHQPHAKQRKFLELECEEAIYGGAAGGGKSDALLAAALQHVDVPHYSAIVFRRTYTDLALPGAIMDRAHEWLAPTAATWNDRDKRWTFPSGATLAFGYLDGPRDIHRYQSAEFQYIAFDELTQFEQRQYLYLFSRLRRTMNIPVPLRMRAATNPGGMGHDWVGERFAMPEVPDQSRVYEHEGRVFVPARIEDNPSLDRDEYERMLAKLDPVTQKQLREGHWVRDASGLVYSCFERDRNTSEVVPQLPAGERWWRVLAMDFGVVDPTAFCVLQFTEHDPICYVVASEEWEDLAPSEAAEKAREWDKRHGGFDIMVGDVGGLGKGFEAEFRKRFRLPLKAASKNDKLGYIKLLNGDLYNGLVKLVPWMNEKLIKDLRALAWKDDKHKEEHPGMDNHLPDALLYGWREVRTYQFTEREEYPVTHAEREQQREADRKARIAERNRRRQDENDSEWILG